MKTIQIASGTDNERPVLYGLPDWGKLFEYVYILGIGYAWQELPAVFVDAKGNPLPEEWKITEGA